MISYSLTNNISERINSNPRGPEGKRKSGAAASKRRNNIPTAPLNFKLKIFV